jgi:putative spermidine/putrescine transport system substrate-binding protein
LTISRVIASAVLALTVGVAGAAYAQQRSVTLSAFAITQDQFRKILYNQFEASCGCEVVLDLGNDADRLAKLDARKANPDVDLAVMTNFSAMEAARRGLIEPIDPKLLTNFNKLYDVVKDPIGGHNAVGYTLYATGIVYRKDKVQINSWKDLWSPTLKNRLVLPSINTSQGPLAVFMADKVWGGTTPDLKTGIAKIAEIKDSNVVTFYATSGQFIQLFQQDEVYAGVTGRYNWPNLKKLNKPLAWATPVEGQTGGMNVMVIVKGAKNRDLAYKLMDMWLSADIQTRLAMELVDSPVNMDVKLPPDVADALTYGDNVKNLHFLPPSDLLAQHDNWLAAWNSQIAK